MITTDSGLKYVDTVVGTGASPAPGPAVLGPLHGLAG